MRWKLLPALALLITVAGCHYKIPYSPADAAPPSPAQPYTDELVALKANGWVITLDERLAGSSTRLQTVVAGCTVVLAVVRPTPLAYAVISVKGRKLRTQRQKGILGRHNISLNNFTEGLEELDGKNAILPC